MCAWSASPRKWLARLRGVWKAVEMTDRQNVPVPERAARVAAAVDDYRGSSS